MTAHAKLAKTAAFDVAAVRRDFPILARRVYGKPLVYLDNAASAQKPRAVLDAMNEFATSEYANVHRGVHFLSAAATACHEAARQRIAQFLNADTDEIIFTKGGTEAINLVSYSYLAPRVQSGDEIVLSVMEHHSNIVPWHFLRERAGAVLKWVDVSDAGELDPSRCRARHYTENEVCRHHAHVERVRNPDRSERDRSACACERRAGAGRWLPGRRCTSTVDLRDLDVDFYAFTVHKLYGPTGIGVLYAKRAHLKAMRPFNGGGEMIREVTKENVTYADPPARFEAGTPPIVAGGGPGCRARLCGWRGPRDDCAARSRPHPICDTQAQANSTGFASSAKLRPRGPSFLSRRKAFTRMTSSTVLDREGVAVRGGHHCAQPLMARFGISSTTRASFALYNTREEVDALMAALHVARKVFG